MSVLKFQQKEETWQNATECRLKMHDQHLALVDEWIEQDFPILYNVIKIQDEYHIMFFLRHVANPHQWPKAIYNCHGKSINQTATIIPNTMKKGCRYNLIVKCPTIMGDQQDLLESVSVLLPEEGNVANTTRKSPMYYNLKPLQTCDESFLKQHQVPKHQSTRVGFCTSIRGELVRRAVDQWVEYHRLIGVDHFWIYINEDWNKSNGTNALPDRPYITYIPFQYTLCNHPTKLGAEEKFRCEKNRPIVQEAVVNDCIYRSKQLRFEWVATPDIDEYIHVVDTNNSIRNTSRRQRQEPPLQQFLNKLYPSQEDRTKIGGIIMKSIPFGRNRRLEPDNKSHPLLLDYVWRRQGNLSNFNWDRHKVVMNPQNVMYASVHNIEVGGRMIQMDASYQIHLHHYKNPQSGVFRASNDSLIVDDSLFVEFRDKVMGRLVDKNFSGYTYSNK